MSEDISDEKWNYLSRLIQNLCDKNMDKLQLDSHQSIIHQIERGRANPHSRVIAWCQIMLEIESCHRENGIIYTEEFQTAIDINTLAKNNFDLSTYKTYILYDDCGFKKICRTVKRGGLYSDNDRLNRSVHDINNKNGDNFVTQKYGSIENVDTVGIRDCTITSEGGQKENRKIKQPVMQRQQLWLEKRNFKATDQINEVKKEDYLPFRPDTRLSRKSFAKSIITKNEKMHTKKTSFTKSSQDFMKINKSKDHDKDLFVDITNKSAKRFKQRKKSIKTVSKKAINSKIKRNHEVQGLIKCNATTQTFDLPANWCHENVDREEVLIGEKIIDIVDSQNSSQGTKHYDEKENAHLLHTKHLKDDISSHKKVEISEEQFDRSVFTVINEECNTATIRIRDTHSILPASIYRKRDRNSGVGRAVSLLVGKSDQSPHEEVVIEIIFYLDAIEDINAWRWWEENRYRFGCSHKCFDDITI